MASTPRSMLARTALLGRVVVEVQQEAALPRSSAVMGSGTVQRRGRMRRAAGVVA